MVFDTHSTPTALYALPTAALLRLDGTGWLGQPDIEQAIELYALASRHPFVANSRWFEDVVGRDISAAAEALPPEDVAGREIAAAAESLPPDVVARAQERGQARDLWVTVEELLAELEAT